ncbi:MULTISPECIES: DUF305 domain-containing protein [unclassified Streptomyces]|uniref:DUF305 domain-containing protein n=1 Tax=unclassified Streptomyces TaxID=2593676 RepID=UPI003D70C34F
MPIRRTFPLRTAAVVAASLILSALAGCDGSGDAGRPAASGPSVIVPGGPGEANRTLSAEEANRRRADDDTPNAADVAYVRMMITHHRQALEMTELAPEHAGSGDVERLAARITAAQGPEIEAMRGWLAAHGQSETEGAHAHEHGNGQGQGEGQEQGMMPGMASEAQLTRLRGARGAAFDELFLTLMITHHQGAVTMATGVKAQGNNALVEEMADEVVAQQTSEIERMRKLLRGATG